MFQGKRGLRAPRRRRTAYRLGVDSLEIRALLAQAAPIDLVNIAGGGPNGVPKAYGVQEAGVIPFGGAGWKVADVGDVNGDGYDDFAISAPGILSARTLNSGPSNTANTSVVFLVFGSQNINSSTALTSVLDYLALNPIGRVGNLTNGTVSGTPFGGLGSTTQINPTQPTTAGAYQFNGIMFTVGAGSNFNWQLGASLTPLGDLNGDGFADFMIGAPGAPDASGNLNSAGRAYIIYGGASYATAGIVTTTSVKTDSLDAPSAGFPPVVTLETGQAGAEFGASGAAGLFFTDDTRPNLIIGAPNGANGAGEVYVLRNAALPTGSAFPNPQFGSETINIDTIGQAGSAVPGLVFIGQGAEDAGFSVASVGNVSRSTSNASQSDLVIGAPLGNATSVTARPDGRVYLVDAELSTYWTTNGRSTNGVVDLSQVAAFNTTTGVPTTNSVTGATFAGDTASEAGFAVAAAGVINGGPSFLIGAPFGLTTAGEAYLITNQGTIPPFGQNIPLNPTTLSALVPGTQTKPTSTSPTVIVPVYSIFEGNLGDLVGYSLTAVGSHFGSTSSNDIAIGAPGTSALKITNGVAGGALDVTEDGAVYWISANNVFTRQTYNLPTAVGTTTTTSGTTTTNGLFGAIIQQATGNNNVNSTTVPPSVTTSPAFLGASISGLPLVGGRVHTVDSDTIGDLIVGAPGYSLATYPLAATPTTTRLLAGAAFVVEGAFVTFSGGGAVVPPPPTPGTGSTATSRPITLGPTEFIPPNGSALIPPVASLSQYDSYTPLAQSIAYAQFRPSQGWLLRMLVFSGKISQSNPEIQRHYAAFPGHTTSHYRTLQAGVFTRDDYHDLKPVKVHHKVTVIPHDRQRSVYQH